MVVRYTKMNYSIFWYYSKWYYTVQYYTILYSETQCVCPTILYYIMPYCSTVYSNTISYYTILIHAYFCSACQEVFSAFSVLCINIKRQKQQLTKTALMHPYICIHLTPSCLFLHSFSDTRPSGQMDTTIIEPY